MPEAWLIDVLISFQKIVCILFKLCCSRVCACVHVCMNVYACVWCPCKCGQRLEVRDPLELWVTLCWCWELSSSPLEDQKALLITELSLQPVAFLLETFLSKEMLSLGRQSSKQMSIFWNSWFLPGEQFLLDFVVRIPFPFLFPLSSPCLSTPSHLSNNKDFVNICSVNKIKVKDLIRRLDFIW